MKKIDKIRIKNFKAFPESQEFDLKGKNLLVYGNNGSGKSSLYWALYTLLQSSEKTVERVNDYFSVYNENDKNTFQSLRNVFSTESESYVEIKLQGEQLIRIEQGNITGVQTASVKEANKASDFINYKLLHNFYNSTHKNNLNLWNVFERDVFPYFGVSGKTFEEQLNDIQSNIPINPVSKRYYRRKSNKYVNHQNKIGTFNTELSAKIAEIQTQTNNVLKNRFGIDDIEVILEYSEKLSWDKNDSRSFNRPEIKLSIKVKKGDTFIINHCPQSFLNEAALTRIAAISVRLGALFTRLAISDWKILVLDDMLISLDMSNRMVVSKIILEDDDLKDFQKIILTHDKGFFDILKSKTNSSEWEYLEFSKDEKQINSKPEIKVNKTELEKSKEFFEANEFEVCANYLRKEEEKIIKNYLNKGLNVEFETLSSLIGQAKNNIESERLAKFNKLLKQNLLPIDKLCEDFENDETLDIATKGKLKTLRGYIFNFIKQETAQDAKIYQLLNELASIKDRILNPASHRTTMPLYSQELKEAIEIVEKLQKLLNPVPNP
jgi:ABC-type dipeptide/oligopeptide/nickel transport system ATPase subunit